MARIAKDVDEYISSAPKELQGTLKQVRSIIRTTVPTAKGDHLLPNPALRLQGAACLVRSAEQAHRSLPQATHPTGAQVRTRWLHDHQVSLASSHGQENSRFANQETGKGRDEEERKRILEGKISSESHRGEYTSSPSSASTASKETARSNGCGWGNIRIINKSWTLI